MTSIDTICTKDVNGKKKESPSKKQQLHKNPIVYKKS